MNRLHAQMQAFVSESQRAAELEEKRRYRFLAEKHLLLSNTFLQFFGRVSWGAQREGSHGALLRTVPSVSWVQAGMSLPSSLSLLFLPRQAFISLLYSLHLFLRLHVPLFICIIRCSLIYLFMILLANSFTSSSIDSFTCEHLFSHACLHKLTIHKFANL